MSFIDDNLGIQLSVKPKIEVIRQLMFLHLYTLINILLKFFL